MNVANGPAPRWQIRVDWADNDHWGAENADLSGDVLALRWQAGRRGLPIPEFAPPATLELTRAIRPTATPPATLAAPWATASGPAGPSGCGPAGFTTTSPPAAPPHGLAPPPHRRWNRPLDRNRPRPHGFTVQDGTVQGLPGWGRPADAVALLDTGDPRATIAARYRRASNGNGGFALRCAAPTNCLRLRFTNSASRLERVNGRPRSALLAEGRP